MPEEKPDKSKIQEIVYDSQPLLQDPAALLVAIWQDLKAGANLGWQLFSRDLKSQYRLSYFGYAWALAPALAASLTFIFLRSQGIVTVRDTGIPYPAYALTGTLLWQVFVDSLNAPGVMVQKSRAMLTKIVFPREALIIASVLNVLFNCLIRLIIVAGVLVLWRISPDHRVLLFFPALAALILLGGGFGLLLTPLSGLYSDIARSLTLATTFLMLLSPVVYPPSESGLLARLTSLNPLTPVILTARQSLVGAELTHLASFTAVSVAGLFLTLLGLVTFRLVLPHVIVRMGG